MQFKDFIITEAANLSAKELQKPNSKTKEPRTDILRRLIKDGKPLELAKGGTVIIGDIEDAMAKIDAFIKMPQNFNLVGTKGEVVKLTQLAKAEVFGGGIGGAGGGTANTKLTESHQCVMLQAMLEHGIQDIDYFTPEIMGDAHSRVSVDEEKDKIIALEGDWFTSSYNIAKLLIQKGYVNKSHTFHRNDNKMNLIYALKSIAYKNRGFAPLKDDKWNPGDIWAIQKGLDLKKELPVDTVNTLNKKMIELFNDRRLVGISLKGPETKFPPPLSEKNNEYPADTDLHKYMGTFLSSKGGTFWSSKNGTIKYDGGEMTLKDNSPGEVVKSEIKGKNARGGGLSWGPMADFIQRETRKKMPKFKSGIFGVAKKIEKGDKRSINVFWGLYKHFEKNAGYDEFLEEIQKKDRFWISAKLGVMYICYYIDKAGGKTANNIITHFVNYAGSKSADSSVYVKAGK